MKKILMMAVILGMADGAYASGWNEVARSGGQFDDLATTASELKAMSTVKDIAIKAEKVRGDEQAGPKKVKFGKISKSERKSYIAKASLWVPEESLNSGAIDFSQGPFNPLRYVPEELVTCKYIPMADAYDGGKPSGKTPKFKCEDPNGRKLKVKYGEQNGEIYSEVAASWIMTAIGAYADKMYPVRISCPDCPSDPFMNESDLGSWPNASRVAVEEKLGERIEVKADSGIGFDEFHLIEDRIGAEALIGLAHFFAHSDNKAPNQAIACLAKDMVADPATGKAACTNPIVYIQDVGAVFGRGGNLFLSKGKMNYDAWAAEPVWSDPAACRLQLRTFITGSLEGVDPSGRDLHQIGEKARQMLVRRLSMLSRAQLAAIFTAARAPERSPRHTAEEWADLFSSKVEKLRNPLDSKESGNFSCPYEVVPANSAPVKSDTNQP